MSLPGKRISCWARFYGQDGEGRIVREVPAGAGGDYPVEPVAVMLRDGRRIELRGLGTGDRASHTAFVEHLSRRSSRLRFFVPLRTLEGAQQDAYFDLDFRDRLALVAVFPGEPGIHAVGRYARESEGIAEVALVVEDSFQGLGLGTALLWRLAGLARDRGFRSFSALVLPENAEMLSLFERTGWVTSVTRGRDSIRLEMDLPAKSPGEPAPGRMAG